MQCTVYFLKTGIFLTCERKFLIRFQETDQTSHLYKIFSQENVCSIDK